MVFLFFFFFPRAVSGPGVRPWQVPAHFSSCSRSRRPGPCPASLVPGCWGRVRQGLLLETLSRVSLVCGFLHP